MSAHGEGWLDADRYLQVIATEAPRLLPILQYEPGRHVPTRPGWSIQDLVGNLGSAFWRESARIRVGGDDEVELPELSPPLRLADLAGWYREGLAELFTQFAQKSAEDVVWSPVGDHRVGWWQRHLAHETLIHRVDAALAMGEPAGIYDGELAADNVSEALGLPLRNPTWKGPYGSFVLVASDRPEWTVSAWTIHLTKDGVDRSVGRQPGLDEVTGPAAEIALVVRRRRRPTQLTAPFRARSRLDRFAEWHDVG